jgi:predicted ATPase
MSLVGFSTKVKAYLKAAGYSQKILANAMGLDPSLLNHKLNSTGRTVLTHPEVREIIKQLASLEAITRQEEALELLALADCPNFSQEAWKAAPLSKLEIDQRSPTWSITGNWAGYSTSNTSENHLTKGNNSTLQPDNASPQNLLPSNTSGKQRHNLPQQLSSFIGRQNEINELKRLLVQDKVRLLTLTGAGGCGKTRLSLEVAAELLESFPDGVWYIELAPLGDPTLIPQTIARALGLAESLEGTFVDTLKAYLHSRHLLLVLDNCEHLIEECARLVETLCRTSTKVKFLASSREAFGINGETTYRVPSLSTPQPHQIPEVDTLASFEAVTLFLGRATAVNPHFTLTKLNAKAVVELCRHLDGIPLAIELAAARTKVLSVEDITARLDDRFQLLTGGSRTALPRQQTLRALIDWSYELLSTPEKKLLAYLSVFAGGWNLKAAQVVSRGEDESITDYEILDGLSGLVNKSLVQTEEGKDDGEIRYYFLETIRQYGLEN